MDNIGMFLCSATALPIMVYLAYQAWFQPAEFMKKTRGRRHLQGNLPLRSPLLSGGETTDLWTGRVILPILIVVLSFSLLLSIFGWQMIGPG